MLIRRNNMNENAKLWNNKIVEEVLNNMNNGYKKQAIVQATGTGKSYIVKNVIDRMNQSNLKYKVLYLSPSGDINEQFEDHVSPDWDIKILTYSMLNVHHKEKLLKEAVGTDYDLIVVDECHRALAIEWNKAYNKLVSLNPQAYIIGLTATPKRVDQLRTDTDTVEELFDGIAVSNLTLPQAINYNILVAPEYYIGVFKIKEQVNKINKSYEENSDRFIDNEPLREKLREMNAKWAKSTGELEVFKEVFKNREKENYKFICFCPNTEFIERNSDSIVDKLSESMDRHIRKFVYHSKDASLKDEWQEFKKAKSGFNILFVINILNEGYHLHDIDGCIMYRGTDSHIIYYQQLGRVLSVGNEKSPIVIDMVNNQAQFSRIEGLNERIREYEVKGGWKWNTGEKTTAEIEFRVIKPDISILVDELDNNINSIINNYVTKDGSQVDINEWSIKYGIEPRIIKMWLPTTESLEELKTLSELFNELKD